MEKKLKIAVIVLSIISIVEFLFIVNSHNEKIQTNANTNVDYAHTNSNEVKKTEKKSKELTDDEIKAKLKVEYVGIGANGDFVIKITNNNDKTIMIDSIDTIFKDSNNIFVKKATTYDQWFGVQPNKTIFVYNSGFKEDFSQYSNYDFNVNIETSSYILEKKHVDNFDITSNDSGKQIAVEIKNNNNFSVEDVSINVVYYKDGNIVGIESGSDIMSNATQPQGTTYINVEYPEDSNYKKVEFDQYEVCLISADMVK